MVKRFLLVDFPPARPPAVVRVKFKGFRVSLLCHHGAVTVFRVKIKPPVKRLSVCTVSVSARSHWQAQLTDSEAEPARESNVWQPTLDATRAASSSAAALPSRRDRGPHWQISSYSDSEFGNRSRRPRPCQILAGNYSNVTVPVLPRSVTVIA